MLQKRLIPVEPVEPRPERPAAPEPSAPVKASLIRRITRGTLKTLLPFAALALGYAGYTYLKATRPESPKQAQTEKAFAVDTVTVRRSDATPAIRLYGNTVAGRQVDIRALVAGRIVETHAELREGGRIDRDETVIAIEAFDYKSAIDEARAQRQETAARLQEQEASLASERASLANARAQLEIAESDVGRARQLTERGNLSDRTLDDRRQILLQRQQAADQLANSIKVWEARIAQTRLAAERLDVAIARAEKRLAETRLAAPFDSFVTEVGAQVGRMVSVNDKVAMLIDRNWIEVQFQLTDSQYGRIVARESKLDGRPVTVRWTLGGETFTYPAEVSRVAARIAPGTGGIDVFARIKTPQAPVPLRPGAFVEAEIADIRFEKVFELPNAALYDGNTVYVVVDNRLDPRKVEVVGTTGSRLLVSGALADGDVIVTTRMSTPGKGVLVRQAAK